MTQIGDSSLHPKHQLSIWWHDKEFLLWNRRNTKKMEKTVKLLSPVCLYQANAQWLCPSPIYCSRVMQAEFGHWVHFQKIAKMFKYQADFIKELFFLSRKRSCKHISSYTTASSSHLSCSFWSEQAGFHAPGS